MDQKLRAYLKRSGISDEALDKIARGEVPDDDTLRKGADNPTLEKFRQVNDMLREIKERLSDIEKADEARRSFARGLALSKLNGHAAIALPKGA
jgi:hypothetical protein